MDTYNLSRDVDPQLTEKLVDFIKIYLLEGLSDKCAIKYYRFILLSFHCKQKNRYNISMLANMFNSYNIKPSLLINIYYHTLNCLALNSNLDIYGDDFII